MVWFINRCWISLIDWLIDRCKTCYKFTATNSFLCFSFFNLHCQNLYCTMHLIVNGWLFCLTLFCLFLFFGGGFVLTPWHLNLFKATKNKNQVFDFKSIKISLEQESASISIRRLTENKSSLFTKFTKTAFLKCFVFTLYMKVWTDCLTKCAQKLHFYILVCVLLISEQSLSQVRRRVSWM